MKGFEIMVNQDRNFVKWVLLSLVTCGIYDLYFIYKLTQDINIVCNGDGDETPGFGMFILLSIVTCGIYTYYWYYKLGDRMQKNGPRYQVAINESGSTILLLLLINLISGGIGTIIATYFVIKNMNTLAVAYNSYINGGNYVVSE